MSTELPKTYDPAAVEAAAYQTWMEEGAFVADPSAPGEAYSIVIPPPNVTGALHLGHAINNTLQDILIRKARMEGKNTLWIPGIDHAGIATQAVVEKRLKEKENKTRHDIGREALVQRIWDWKNEYGDRILNQLKRLGCSCDWSRTRFTLDEGLARAVRENFFKLFKDGLIYRGKRLVNWDIHLQTSISDDEIYHETVKTSLWHVKYPIEGTDRFMVVATTRPETMLGDTAVAVHPEDGRWNWAIGKQVRLPLTDRLIPIIADAILVDPTFGSGVVKVTPAHDPNDYAVWQRHQNQADEIDLINILNSDGTLNENAGAYKGMKREAARKKVVADLEGEGLLEKIEPYETQVGHSDRSKTPVEPYLSDQWFVHMAPLAEPALEVVREGIIQFFPERHRQQYLAWLGEKRDWPISRQLWWGHRIPVWRYSFATAPRHGSLSSALGGGKQHAEAIRRVEQLQQEGRLVRQFGDKEDSYKYESINEKNTVAEQLICVRDPDDTEVIGLIESIGFIQDPDVLDTWFSSALWPFSTLGWPEETEDLKKYYPTSVLLTDRGIITLWVARMVMMGLYDMGEIPFPHVAINPTILDGNGERMSKSKGNGVDPVEIIDIYGADALRFTLMTMATETQDVRMPVQKDAQGRNTSKKFDEGRNFCNKLWNAARFVLGSLEGVAAEPVEEGKWSLADRWIISRFNRTVEEAEGALKQYRFDQYARVCYDFFWRDFCDWYVEAAKPAMKDPQRAGQTAGVLAAVLDGALRLTHPMIPFITETIWWRLCEVRPERGLPGYLMGCTSRRLIGAAWPRVGAVDGEAESVFARIQEIVTAIRHIRNSHKVDPKKPVTASIVAAEDLAEMIRSNRELIELLAICHLKEIGPDVRGGGDAARIAAAGGDIFIEGLVDETAEKERIGRRRAELKKQIAALRGRLSNEGYMAKAPAHLVQQSRDQLAVAEAEMDKIGQ